MAKHSDSKKDDHMDAAPKTASNTDPKAEVLPGSYETEQMRIAREDREKAAAEAGGEVRMSPVNPRKPLDKEPVYIPGVGPNLAAGDMGGPVPTDPRVPPENVTTPGVAPGNRTVTATGSTDPVPGEATAQPAVKAPEPLPVITPAQAGLAQPHLRAGLDPLPEEDPTPSTVPIPPPGPRRVA